MPMPFTKCALCGGENGGHDMTCIALGADAQDRAQTGTLEAAIARAHPANDPIVKLREIASRLQAGTMDGIAEYKLGKWLDAWLDRYTA